MKLTYYCETHKAFKEDVCVYQRYANCPECNVACETLDKIEKYPLTQICESGDPVALERLKSCLRGDIITGINPQAGLPHHCPCYGCGRLVHAEYCFDYILEVVVCDPCSKALGVNGKC